MTWDRFLHILCFLHFADNSQKPGKGEEYDWLRKLRTVFDKLNEAYAKFYNPSEHLAVGEVIVKFKNRVLFRQYISKKKNVFWHQNLQTLWWIRVYIWHESVLGRVSHSATNDMTATHAAVRHLTSRVEGLGQNIYGQFLFIPKSLWWLGQT